MTMRQHLPFVVEVEWLSALPVVGALLSAIQLYAWTTFDFLFGRITHWLKASKEQQLPRASLPARCGDCCIVAELLTLHLSSSDASCLPPTNARSPLR